MTMAAKKTKKKQASNKGTPQPDKISTEKSGVALERSQVLDRFKREHNLPKWGDVQKLEKMGLLDQVEWKIAQMERFAAVNKMIHETIHAAGWSETTLIHNIVDLHSKLLDLEERLRTEGKNPLESPEWMKAREALTKDLQFVQKQDLDVSKFLHGVEKSREKRHEDDLFTIEADD
jgi:hypothetical protein